MIDFFSYWDNEFLIIINSLNTGGGDFFWVFVTQTKNWVWLYLLLVVSYIKLLPKKTVFRAIIFNLLILVVTLSLTTMAKEIFARVRPSNVEDLQHAIRVLKQSGGFSFWSGHAANSFSITVFAYAVLKKYSRYFIMMFIWPILFAVSRLFVGVHYPLDILIGAFVGVIFGYIGYRFYCIKAPILNS